MLGVGASRRGVFSSGAELFGVGDFSLQHPCPQRGAGLFGNGALGHQLDAGLPVISIGLHGLVVLAESDDVDVLAFQ